jgi:hypothetical protein
MKPSVARNRLGKRRAWLVARSESLRADSPDKPTYFLDEEVEALDYVLGVLEAVGGDRNGGAVADQPERIQRAKDVMAARGKVCSCARCPVHGDLSSGKVGQ